MVIVLFRWIVDELLINQMKIITQNRGLLFMFMATVICITIITASQLFTAKVSRLLDLQASELLAADALVLSNKPINPEFKLLALDSGLKTAETVTLQTAVFIQDKLELMALKAVDSAYPLRGYLEVKEQFSDTAQKQTSGPSPGNAWVDQQVAHFRNETSIALGQHSFKPNKILSLEPDRGGSLFNLAPRIMIHLDDLPKTNLILPGSRAKYHLLISGAPDVVKQFLTQIEFVLSADETIQSVQNARPEMRTALERVNLFFALGVLMAVVISLAAIAISARYIATLEAKKVSVFRAFGVPQSQLLKYYLYQLSFVLILAIPVGWAFGLIAQIPIEQLLGQWFNHSLPTTGWQPFLVSGLFGAIGLFGFSLPFIFLLLNSKPHQVLRQQFIPSSLKHYALFALMLIPLAMLLSLLIDDLTMVRDSLIAISLLVIIVPSVIYAGLKLIKKLLPNPFWIRSYVISRVLLPQRNALFSMTAFMLTLLALLIVGSVKDDLFSDWKSMLAEDSPNYFAINIQPDKTQNVAQALEKDQLKASQLYPLVNARVQAINGDDIEFIEFNNQRADHFKKHVFKLSSAERLPAENAILEGQWPPTDKLISLEQSMAKILNIKLNDTVTFDIAGQAFTFTISSIRSVVWENFKPNFYVLTTPEILSALPKTYIMSTYIPADKQKVLADYKQQFPAITWLDITQIMARIKNIIDRSSLALEFFFAFAVIAGILVLLSSVLASQQQRKSEIALLKAMGVDRNTILKTQIYEFALMGLIIAFFACGLASLLGYLVAEYIFSIPYHINFGVWLIALVSSVSLMVITGVLAIRKTLANSPIQLLRSM